MSDNGQDTVRVDLGISGISIDGGSQGSLSFGSGSDAMSTTVAARKGTLARVVTGSDVAHLQAAGDTNFVFGKMNYTCRSDGKT